VTVESVLGRALASWLTFAALTPVALSAAQRWPLAARGFLPHVLAAATFTLLHLGITGAILTQVLDHSFGSLLSYLFVAYAALDLLLYLVIVGGWQAIETERRLRARELRTSLLEGELKRAQLEALQLQLNPHFLFNTLNAIAGLALRAEGQRTADALAVLADLLRDNLSAGATVDIPLREEVRIVERFLEVWRLRLGDRLVLAVRLSPGTETVLVPRFILQPLIENAVLHGILPGEQSGRITIASRLTQGELEVEIEDDGIGIGGPTREAGLGLANVRQRLDRVYGNAGRLTLSPRPQGGTRVLLRVPVRIPEARQAP
jgi:sensor histidine kinase YesM